MTTDSFTLFTGEIPVVGIVTLAGSVATFDPEFNLDFNTLYKATIKTNAQDEAGNYLSIQRSWSFTTGDFPVILGPSVVSMVPMDKSNSVAPNATIGVTFKETMDPSTINSDNFTLSNGTSLIPGTVTYQGYTAKFVPALPLEYNTLYTVTVKSQVNDSTGSFLANNIVWSFSTGSTPDTTAPTVVSTFPMNNAVNVPVNDPLKVSFSEAMNPATLVAANITLVTGSTAVAGSFTYDIPTKTLIFSPKSNLENGKLYTINLGTGVKDLADNALAQSWIWSFETETLGLGPAPVVLGSAANFAILAKTGISTVPSSLITGDIGVSPVAETYLTGFSQTKAIGYSTSPQVVGFIYAADMTPPTPANMTTSISDMEAAYTDAATRPAPAGDHTNIGAGTIGGLTLAPGLYAWSTTVTIPTDLTLEGGAKDIWIFQITKDLSLASAKKIILAGGAQAKNIFWQVAGVASLETGSHFEGIILSQTAVILKTGASMNGRILAQSRVTLGQATLTEPY